MNTPAPLLNALRDLRHSIGFTAALCDTIIFGSTMDARSAHVKLPDALRMLAQRAQRALNTMEDQP